MGSNDLEEIKFEIQNFINKYDIKYMGINIEEPVSEVCAEYVSGEQIKSPKKVLINIEF